MGPNCVDRLLHVTAVQLFRPKWSCERYIHGTPAASAGIKSGRNVVLLRQFRQCILTASGDSHASAISITAVRHAGNPALRDTPGLPGMECTAREHRKSLEPVSWDLRKVL